MTGVQPSGAQHTELRLGDLLAEGGEGRVFEVLSSPGPTDGRPRVYKELRRSSPVEELSSLVTFPSLLASSDAALSARVLSSSAWPLCVVVGDDPALALGTLMPRAPDEFWVRHRDGNNRLASLSYLANDPDRIEVAYGVMMPAPGAPERVALVYALARLLDAWQSGPPRPQVVHGDLSAKNVLWSLRPAPAIYVLDCDGAAVTPFRDEPPASPDDDGPEPPAPSPPGEATSREATSSATSPAEGDRPDGAGGALSAGGEAGAPAEAEGLPPAPRRHRATTPNWSDPAVRLGGRPTAASDRYLLAITFLRIVGAAHFPIQGHQRRGQKVEVDLELPRSWRKFPDMPGLWSLCERSLSLVNATDRPTPAEWVAHLEELLGVLSANELAASVRLAQGDPRPAPSRPAANGARRATEPPRVAVPDVVVRPVLRHRAPSTWQLIRTAPPLGVGGEAFPGAVGGLSGGRRAGAGAGSVYIAAGAPGSFGGAGGGAASASARGTNSGVGLGSSPTPLSPRQMAAQVMVTWGGAHRVAARWARSPGRRAYGARRLAGVLVIDLAAACIAVFVVAMIISPWIGL